MAEMKMMVLGVRHCYIEYNNSGVLAFKRAWYTKECEFKVNSAKLEFAGDGQKLTRDYGYQCDGTIAAEIDDDTLDSILWAIPKTAPGGGDNFATRYYHGTDNELQANYVGVRLTLDGQNADTGAPLVVVYRALKVIFDPDTPVKYATEAVGGRMLSWNGFRALTDIAGNALTTIPSRGAFWMKDIVTNATYFDPVPGDIL